MLAVRRSLSLALLGLLALALAGGAEARIDRPAVAAPQGLQAFLLRTDEAPKHEFDRTPSFAWLPVRGALRYEFELATSRSFSESSIIWSNTNDELAETTTSTAAGGTATVTGTTAEKMKKLYANLKSPAVSIDVALPWITGSPYALYAHVRAHTVDGPTPWSTPFGFNIRWTSIPRDLDSKHAGLVRWSPVEGATAYQVWIVRCQANVHDDDERRGRTRPLQLPAHRPLLHELDLVPRPRTADALRGGGLRAARDLVGAVEPNLQRPSAPALAGRRSRTSQRCRMCSRTPRQIARTHSRRASCSAATSGGSMDYYNGASTELFRVYVATDRDCVNIVYTRRRRRQPCVRAQDDWAATAAAGHAGDPEGANEVSRDRAPSRP